MAIKSENEIYKIIEKYLKESPVPLSSADLWERADVQAHSRSAEKVSDYLGLMWRRGIIQRFDAPATATSRSRYAYAWLDHVVNNHQKVERLVPVNNSYKKSNVVITEEENRIVLDFDKFTLTIQAKG